VNRDVWWKRASPISAVSLMTYTRTYREESIPSAYIKPILKPAKNPAVEPMPFSFSNVIILAEANV
jgi:hypothetical protein